MKEKLTIIIPARNEEEHILKTLEELRKNVKIPYKIIVVNDCSSDSTEKLVIECSKKNKNISIVSTTPSKKGFAQALVKGIKEVRSGSIVIVMADLCDDPKTINIMYKKTQEGWDVVCGSRYIKGGGKKGGPIIQSFFSTVICLSLYWLIGLPTKDVSNAFKMYRKEVLDNIVINPKSGVEASMEMTLSAFFQGAKITDVPTFWTGRVLGQSKFKILERSPRYIRIFIWALYNQFLRK